MEMETYFKFYNEQTVNFGKGQQDEIVGYYRYLNGIFKLFLNTHFYFS